MGFRSKAEFDLTLQDCAWVLIFFTHPGNTRIKSINTAYKLFPFTQPLTHTPPALNPRQKTEQAVGSLSTAKLI